MAAQLSGVPMFRDLDQMYPIDETLGLESPSTLKDKRSGSPALALMRSYSAQNVWPLAI